MNYLIEPQNFSFGFDLTSEMGRGSRYLNFDGRTEIRKYVDRGLELGNQLVESKATYSIGKNSENLIERYHLPGPLKSAELLAFGISTIGTELEHKVDELMEEGDYALSHILDSVGSAAVNETSDRLGKKILDYSKKNDLKNTRSFSPGSGSSHWNIKNQQLIFENLNPSDIEVRLTSTFAIVPKKSSSFVIGLGKEVKQARDLFSCEECERTDCPYRNRPSKPVG